MSQELNAMLIDKERSGLLPGGPSPKVHPSEQFVPRMIAARARLKPDAIALVMGSEKLTYAELELRANQLANHLRSLGAGPEVLVGLCMDRSPEFVVAALAIMQCGAVVSVVDSSAASSRCCDCASSSRTPPAAFLVTQRTLWTASRAWAQEWSLWMKRRVP